MTDAAALAELAAADREIDETEHLRTSDPAFAALAAAKARRAQWESSAAQLREAIAGLDEKIAADEREDHELFEHRQRLEKQLKTVIAPREAEALMHEIATIDARRNELDDDELEALERESELDDELATLRAEETEIDATVVACAAEATEATVRLDRRRAELDEVITRIRGGIGHDVLERYDRHRHQFGVGAAKLDGRRCVACHLDLSAGEVDVVKREAAETGVAECPSGRHLLIVSI